MPRGRAPSRSRRAAGRRRRGPRPGRRARGRGSSGRRSRRSGGGPRRGPAGRPCVGSLPRTMFSRTVKLSASMKCWCTMPMPAAMASAGLRKLTSRPSSRIWPSSGRCIAVERLHQRRLAGAVLAHDGVHLTAADPQLDVAVGHDAGEPLGDARAAPPRGARSPAGRRVRPAPGGRSPDPPGAAMVGLSLGCGRAMRGARPLSAPMATGSTVSTGWPGPGPHRRRIRLAA